MPRGPIEAAAYWVMRRESPNCGPADRAAFEAWRLQSDANARAHARAQRALATVDRHLHRSELTGLAEQVLDDTTAQRASWPQRTVVGLAAACALIVGGGLLREIVPRDAAQRLSGADPVPAVSTFGVFETAVGERSTITLSDSSTVTLNTDSRVSVHFIESSTVRRLRLERGQAHFEVEKDQRPFEVFAGDRRIVALGTAFDVRLDAMRDTVQVTLVEGRIAVDKVVHDVGRVTAGPIAPASDVTRQLEAGEQLISKPDEPPTVVAADIERVIGWREGWLLFRDDALPDAVAEINRYSATKLIVGSDERLEEIRIGGAFQAGRTTTFIEAVESIAPVKAHRVAYDRIQLFWLGEGSVVAESDTTQPDVREAEPPASTPQGPKGGR